MTSLAWAAVALILPAVARAHGSGVPAAELSGAWSAPPLVLATAGVAAACYARGVQRLRGRGDVEPRVRDGDEIAKLLQLHATEPP